MSAQRRWSTRWRQQRSAKEAKARSSEANGEGEGEFEEDGFSIRANVTLPPSFANSPPKGGLRLRLRVPVPYAGKLKSVTVGGKAWAAFDAVSETVDFAPAELGRLSSRPRIVASFA